MSAPKKKKTPHKKENTGMFKPDHDIVRGAKNNDIEEVKAALRQKPGCINASDYAGLTALHWAGANANYAICAYLFDFSHPKYLLNPWIPDSRDRLAVDHAIGTGSDHLVALFRTRMITGDVASDNPPPKKFGTVLTPSFRKKEP